MNSIKTKKEIEIMREGGRILSEVLRILMEEIKVGMTQLELDKIAEEEIIKKGGLPSFKMVKGYNYATCISAGDVVVHGIPKNIPFKKGDIVGIDCGVFYRGYHTDMGETVLIQDSELKIKNLGKRGKSGEIERFLAAGKKALFAGINQARAGNRVGHISKAMQEIIEGNGYSVTRSLVGHGIGKKLHDDPEIPGFLDRKIGQTPILRAGMTIAIEIIYNMGKEEVVYEGGDDWTIVTKDGSLSSFFERTVLITENGPSLLTKLWID